MSKYLILWELNICLIPENPEKQMVFFTRLMNMVSEDFKIGLVDWGEFAGGHSGYAISEGTEKEIALSLMKYSPYIKFVVNPVLSVSQVEENMKMLSQA